MPEGAPIAELSLRPKQATSIVLKAVVVIDGVELLTCPPDASMGAVALLALPLLAVLAPRNPMTVAAGQVSARSHSPVAARHTAPALPGACWQLVLVPSQVSVVHGSPSSAQAAPTLPAGCAHVALVPAHMSVVQALPSSVHAVVLD